jgi:hypothetical protein
MSPFCLTIAHVEKTLPSRFHFFEKYFLVWCFLVDIVYKCIKLILTPLFAHTTTCFLKLCKINTRSLYQRSLFEMA